MKLRKALTIFVGGLLSISPVTFVIAENAKSIRDIDLKAYIIKRDNLVEGCKELYGYIDEGPIHFWEVEFADLDGDGTEEAVVEAATCVMGTGGSDIVEVLKLLPSGEWKQLDVTHEGYREPQQYDGMGSTPRLDIKDGKLISWYVIHAKNPGKPKRGWTKTLIYRWEKNRFVVDRVTETLPMRPEEYR